MLEHRDALSAGRGGALPGTAGTLAALALFWPVYRQLVWRLDPVALAAGAVIGVVWVIIPYNPTDYTPAYGELTGALVVGWMVMRGLGTIVLVPIIEELFFRDYLEGRLRQLVGPILAVIISAGLLPFCTTGGPKPLRPG